MRGFCVPIRFDSGDAGRAPERRCRAAGSDARREVAPERERAGPESVAVAAETVAGFGAPVSFTPIVCVYVDDVVLC